MVRRFLSIVALALCACERDTVAPEQPALRVANRIARQVDDSPPPPRDFGPDTYRVGLFTGAGTTRPGLDCEKTAPDVRTCSGFLASSVDGALLDVRVEIPLKIDKAVPLVALIHGYAGSKGGSGDIARALVADGYAVLRHSTRGFGQSWGQVNLVDVHAEVADLRSMIAQVVDLPQLHLDADAVAVTGASYGGGHSWLAAVQPTFTTPRGKTVRIRTVVPIATWSDLLYSLLPNGYASRSLDEAPGGAKLSFINALYFGGIREDPERPYPNYPEYFVAWHAWINATEPTTVDPVFTSIADGLAGYRSAWWQEQFWESVRTTRLPIFVAQGFTDDLFPIVEADRMVRGLRSIDPAYPVAAYYGDIGHPRASNKTAEIDYALSLIRSWLAFYMKGEGTAPPHVVYAALTRARDEAFDPGNVVTGSSLAALATTEVVAELEGSALLVNPLTDPAGGFFWDPLVMEAARELRSLPVPPESPIVSGSLVTYDVPVSELTGGTALTIAGVPVVSLHVSTLAPRVQLNVRLFDVDASGTKQLVTRGTITVEGATLGAPIGDVDVVLRTYGNFWRAEGNHTLHLELTNVDSPYITPSRIPSATTVSAVRLRLPVRR